jgi:hypothetical protein
LPHSSHEGKAWALNRLRLLFGTKDPNVIIDIGCGAGVWLDVLKPHFLTSKFIGVEVFRPYHERFLLPFRYDIVLDSDARSGNWPEGDVVILGDILEHMTEEEAIQLFRTAKKKAYRAVILSIPIVHYPQGELAGNPYEVHVEEDWTVERVIEKLGRPAAYSKGQTVGTFLWLTP